MAHTLDAFVPSVPLDGLDAPARARKPARRVDWFQIGVITLMLASVGAALSRLAWAM